MSGFYRPAPIPTALTVILAGLPSDQSVRIERTFQFAAAAHAGQLRDEGTPFIEHPVRVAAIIWSELKRRDPDLIAAALTHDVLEDCPDIGATMLGEIIGVRALAFVEDVTKGPVGDGTKEERDRAYLESLPRLPLESRVVKLADRIDNVRSVVHSPEIDKARRYLDVTRAAMLPLASATDITAHRILATACDELEAYLATVPARESRTS